MASRRPLASLLEAPWLRRPTLRTSLPFYKNQPQGLSRQLRDRKNSPDRSFQRNYSKEKPRGIRPSPPPNLGSPESHSITARLKKLSREYGWTVIGVYLALTVADLPLCFLAVKYIGAERIAYAEHVVVSGAKDLINRAFPNLIEKESVREVEAAVADAEEDHLEGAPTEHVRHTSIAKLTPDISLLDEGRFDVHCTQIFHLHQSATHGSHYAKGGENAAQLGLRHWEETVKVDIGEYYKRFR